VSYSCVADRKNEKRRDEADVDEYGSVWVTVSSYAPPTIRLLDVIKHEHCDLDTPLAKNYLDMIVRRRPAL
jgi:hypothetical protein